MKKANDQLISDQIRACGLKASHGRIAILRSLATAGKPMTIDNLKRELGGTVNMVTIYRAMRQLVAAGLVYQTDFRDGKTYFEYQDTHHHHIICTSCGRKETVHACIKNKLPLIAQASRDFSAIHSHVLEFFGICRGCQTRTRT